MNLLTFTKNFGIMWSNGTKRLGHIFQLYGHTFLPVLQNI